MGKAIGQIFQAWILADSKIYQMHRPNLFQQYEVALGRKAENILERLTFAEDLPFWENVLLIITTSIIIGHLKKVFIQISFPDQENVWEGVEENTD